MSRWLYLAAGWVAGLATALAVVVITGDGDQGTGPRDPSGAASAAGAPGGTSGEVPPEVAEVEAALQAYRRSVTGEAGNPCELMTPKGRTPLYGPLYMGPSPAADAECAMRARQTTLYEYKRQREVPVDAETDVVVQGDQAAAVEVTGVPEPLFFKRTRGHWLLAARDELSAAQALEEALTRGEGL